MKTKLLLSVLLGLSVQNCTSSLQSNAIGAFLSEHKDEVNVAAVALMEAFISNGKISSTKTAALVRTITFLGAANIGGSLLAAHDDILMESLKDRITIGCLSLLINYAYNHQSWFQKVINKIGLDALPPQLNLQTLNIIGALFFWSHPWKNVSSPFKKK